MLHYIETTFIFYSFRYNSARRLYNTPVPANKRSFIIGNDRSTSYYIRKINYVEMPWKYYSFY